MKRIHPNAAALIAMAMVSIAQADETKDPDYWVEIPIQEALRGELPNLPPEYRTLSLDRLRIDPEVASRLETFRYCQKTLSEAKGPLDIRKDPKLLGYYTFDFKGTPSGVEVKWVHHDYRGNQEVGTPFIYGPFSLEKLASHIHFFSNTHSIAMRGGEEFGPQEISAKLSAAGVPASEHVKVIATPLELKDPSQTEKLRAQRDDLVRIYLGRVKRCRDQGYYSAAKVERLAAELRSAEDHARNESRKSLACSWVKGRAQRHLKLSARTASQGYCIGEVECKITLKAMDGAERGVVFTTHALCPAGGGASAPRCPDATSCAKDESTTIATAVPGEAS